MRTIAHNKLLALIKTKHWQQLGKESMKCTLFILLALIIPISVLAQPAGYSFGKQIIIHSSQVSGTTPLINFPILINSIDNDLRTTGNGGKVENANGYDIIFTEGDCITRLDHQIEKYNAITGELVAWVRIPSLPATVDKTIHMYYGNSSISVNPSTTNTWDSNYEVIFHMSENPGSIAPQITNSTVATNNGTTSGAMTAADLVAGKCGDAIDFDGNDDVLEAVDNQPYAITTVNFTLECWVKSTDGTTTNMAFITNYGGVGQTPFFMLGFDASNVFFWIRNSSNVSSRPTTPKGPILNGAWHHLVAVRSSTGTYLYVDGALKNSAAALTSDVTFGTSLSIMDHFNRYTLGQLDEVRISSTARSPDWILTQYNNQNSPSTFYSISEEMLATTLCIALPIELLNFEAYYSQNQVQLNWQTASELNNDFFTIERSINGSNWGKLVTVDGAGNSSFLLNYSTIDNNPYSGISYYRLKQTDFNGQFKYSQIRSVNIKSLKDFQIEIYPNPTSNQITIMGNETELESISIYDIRGRDITNLTKKIMDAGTKLVIDLSELNAGTYYIKTKNTNNKVSKL